MDALSKCPAVLERGNLGTVILLDYDAEPSMVFTMGGGRYLVVINDRAKGMLLAPEYGQSLLLARKCPACDGKRRVGRHACSTCNATSLVTDRSAALLEEMLSVPKLIIGKPLVLDGMIEDVKNLKFPPTNLDYMTTGEVRKFWRDSLAAD
jgi:hypothetical protein